MRYLLDTNACIHYLNPTHPALVRRVQITPPSRLAVSAVTVAELRFGAENSGRPHENLARIRVLLDDLNVEPFTVACAEAFGALKASVVRRGTPMADFDLAIAATALATGRAIVTADRDFDRVPGLIVEDWSRS